MDQIKQTPASMIEAEKFNKVFGSLEKQLLLQSSFLESIYNIQTKQFDMDRDRDKKEAARLAALSAKGAEETIGGDKTEKTDKDKSKDKKGEQKEFTLSNIIPGIGNFIGSLFGTAGGMGLAGLGSKVLGAGALAILAPAVGDFIAEFAKSALDDWNPDGGEFNTGVSSALGDGVKWGMIGNIFGKKIGLIFGAAAAGGSLGESIFKSFDTDKDGIINAFGMSFTSEEAGTLGTAIGGALGLFLPGMISSALGPVFAAMTLPGVGLVAISAAALVGGAYLVDKWMTARRTELMDNINNELKDGLDKFKAEKDRSILDKIGTSIFGAGEEDGLGAQLDVLDSKLAAEKQRQAVLGARTRGGKQPNTLDLSKIEDEEFKVQLEETKQKLQAAISGADNLEGLSVDKLEQLSRMTSLFNLDAEHQKVVDQLNKLSAAADLANQQSYDSFQTGAEAMSSIPSSNQNAPNELPTPEIVQPQPSAADIANSRSDNALIEKLNKLEKGSSSAPKIIPVPMPMPGQGTAAAPSNIDQSTTTTSTTIFAGRSKWDELDTYVLSP